MHQLLVLMYFIFLHCEDLRYTKVKHDPFLRFTLFAENDDCFTSLKVLLKCCSF